MTCALSASGKTLGQSLNGRFYAEPDVMTSRDLPPLSAPARCRPVLRITGRPGQLGNQLVGRLEATGSQTRRDHRLEGLELQRRIGARVHLGRLHVRVVGTIASQLSIHHTTVQRVLAQAGLEPDRVSPRPSMADPYLGFIVETLEK